MTKADSWAHAAARAPLGFSQVREDPLLEEALLRNVGPNSRVFLIASGGDTAAWLAARGEASALHLVDFNPAQLALTQLKLRLLRSFPPDQRWKLLGHAPMPPVERAGALAALLAKGQLPSDALGPLSETARLGPDYVGRYERLFAEFQSRLRLHRDGLERLLREQDTALQSDQVRPESPLGSALDAAFAAVMRIENLVALFGGGATRQPRLPFAEHFAERTRHLLDTQPARHNPYLAQMLLGRFIDGHGCAWLDAPAPPVWPKITWACAPALPALTGTPPGSFDLVQLSNILDWLTPEEAAATLEAAYNALSPGGFVCIRQLNSTLDVHAAGPRFQWCEKPAADWLRRDRSFFYRAVFIGAKAD